MEAFHLEVGLCRQLFGMPLTILPTMTLSWFTQMWQYCKMLDINMTTDITDFELTRYQDKELMRIFIQFGATGQDLASLNRCQMYIHAIYLLDICNGSGTAIDNWYWEGKSVCPLEYIWLTTAKPTTMEWQVWRKTMSLALSTGHNGQLVVPLGKWRESQATKDGFFIDPWDKHLYEQ